MLILRYILVEQNVDTQLTWLEIVILRNSYLLTWR